MEQIFEYINQLFVGNGIVIAVGGYILGVIIKQSLDFIPNKYIPLICGVIGALSAAFVPELFPDTAVYIKAVNGLALGWAATGAFEAVRNLKSHDN